MWGNIKVWLLNLVVSIALFLFSMWVVWGVWDDVFVYFWPTGPENILHPSYLKLVQFFTLITISITTIDIFLNPPVKLDADNN